MQRTHTNTHTTTTHSQHTYTHTNTRHSPTRTYSSLPLESLHPSRGWSKVDQLVTLPYLHKPSQRWSTCWSVECQNDPTLINMLFSEKVLLVNFWSTWYLKSISRSTVDQQSCFYNIRKRRPRQRWSKLTKVASNVSIYTCIYIYICTYIIYIYIYRYIYIYIALL